MYNWSLSERSETKRTRQTPHFVSSLRSSLNDRDGKDSK